jgi:hypothetical protein
MTTGQSPGGVIDRVYSRDLPAFFGTPCVLGCVEAL